ncbi:sulfatase [Lignipirellula cremea]|uniref:sulfatase n=1 Tax=Lignipirellula cremea TaxID=2528010 RepID=UPI001E41D0B2|nr:sulfatase [Lignipirellula cremea]
MATQPVCPAGAAEPGKRPNVLILSIDDLNDWTGCLGGHPQARTPNIDRLARRGTLFSNAHCQAPICTPSRASLVTGLLPSTTGLYFLQPGLTASPVTKSRQTLPEHFAAAGYHTMGAGKFIKGNGEEKYFQQHGGALGGFGPIPPQKLAYPDGLKLWDWGPFPADEADMPDTRIADWAIARLAEPQEKPFLLVAGFWRPHVPMFAPQKWFDLFPADEVKLPETRDDDRADLPPYALDLTIGLPAPRHEWFVEHEQWDDAVRAYLASVAYVDHCVGRVLTALEASPHAENTIVVLFSDHGWHLGEKQRWAKRSLWNDSTRVPLIIAGAGQPAAQVCGRPVGLVDIYPTLLQLTGLPPITDHDGQSLAPLLADPTADWERPALTTFGPKSHSLRSTDWHYIRYADGSEELYDHQADPHEWSNLAADPGQQSRLAEFREQLPTRNADPVLSQTFTGWEVEAWQTAEKNAAARKEK